MLSVLPAVARYGRKQESFRLIRFPAQPDDLIPQHGRILVLHHPRGLAHVLLQRQIEKLEKSMREAARMMEYEYAAVLRDEIIRLRGEANQAK